MDAGLLLDGELKIGGTSSERCKVEGRGKEKRGWYWLHEAPIEGRLYLVGAYGVYDGNDPGTQKVELTKQCDGDSCRRSVSFKEKKCPYCGSKVKHRELSKEQKDAIRTRLAEDKKREEGRRRNELERAARRAEKMWSKCLPIAEQSACPYLVSRGIQPHRLRMTPNGTMVVPMQDPTGRVWGLQFIGPEVRKKLKDDDKKFWPYGTSQTDRFFMIGTRTDVILVCEGFVTGAALHEETGLCVVVAFNAGNLRPVADVIHKKYRSAKLLICADDDFATRGNPGVAAATLAALAVGGAWVAPIFPADEPMRADLTAANIDFEAKDYKQQVEAIRRGRKKLTDFDDLRTISPPHAVSVQINAKLDELGWNRSTPVRPAQAEGEGVRELTPITSTQELFDRFAIIYGHNKSLFDFRERMLLSIDDMKNACSGRETWRAWMESQDKKIVRIENVGFDPVGEDAKITCNLFGGWPTKAEKGECSELLNLLEYLCSGEKNPREIYKWALNWLAYPIQNPGAKMKTALVLHGPQGTGKNLFFEAVMTIYGQYGRIVDQMAIEDKFNDWASKKLFMIADEVVARQELYHTKNKLKGFITGDWIRINPKNVASHEERNHVNIVFLSNERQPLVIENDDRRYTIIWTPKKLSRDYYSGVAAEISAGGIAALHHYLKYEHDLGGFQPWTEPPMTDSKKDLIAFSLDSAERFLRDWENGETEYPFCPCGSMDLFAAYLRWCRVNGVYRPRESNQFLGHIAKLDGWSNQPCSTYENANGGKNRTRRMVIPDEVSLAKSGSANEEGIPKMQWLTDCFFEFHKTIEDAQ
jgi:putative DNA primase/helicase